MTRPTELIRVVLATELTMSEMFVAPTVGGLVGLLAKIPEAAS
jgi:hypothetical protein